MREIYWHLGIIDVFKAKNELTSIKYANKFNEFFNKIIKCNEEE